MSVKKSDSVHPEIIELRQQLAEANDLIEAIRTGQIDALVVNGAKGHELYTLKTADQSYRVFIEKMIEGAISIDKDDVILYANCRFSEMVGIDLHDIIGSRLSDHIAPEEAEHFRKVIASSWEGDFKEELCLKTAAGEMPVQVSLATLDVDSVRVLSIVLTDLTEQKKTQKQLRENNRKLLELNNALEASNSDLMQFASVASHDLQEPLRKIQIFSQMLKENNGDLKNIDYQNYIEKIIHSASRMRTLIVDVLNYSKLSMDDNSFEKLDLTKIVEEVLEDFELLVSEKSATINYVKLPVIKGIRGQVRQVFQNVISNALKFSKKDVAPVIDINFRMVNEKSFTSPEVTDGNYFIVSIKDNGIGFEEKYQENIFAIFERLNSKEAYEGTGIGMAIARKIMDKHHGLITAKSALGEGSEFLLLFPITKKIK